MKKEYQNQSLGQLTLDMMRSTPSVTRSFELLTAAMQTPECKFAFEDGSTIDRKQLEKWDDDPNELYQFVNRKLENSGKKQFSVVLHNTQDSAVNYEISFGPSGIRNVQQVSAESYLQNHPEAGEFKEAPRKPNFIDYFLNAFQSIFGNGNETVRKYNDYQNASYEKLTALGFTDMKKPDHYEPTVREEPKPVEKAEEEPVKIRKTEKNPAVKTSAQLIDGDAERRRETIMKNVQVIGTGDAQKDRQFEEFIRNIVLDEKMHHGQNAQQKDLALTSALSELDADGFKNLRTKFEKNGAEKTLREMEQAVGKKPAGAEAGTAGLRNERKIGENDAAKEI